jgi:N6-adenosine-specific RNA methylase IME4
MTAQPSPLLFSGPDWWPFGDLKLKGYGMIMADPPWRFELYSEKGEAKSAQAQYRTMPIDEISRLPVFQLAADHCVLWLWSTWPMLRDAFDVVKAWGFEYKTGGTWFKRTVHGKPAFGTGYILRSACEPFLIATRGEPRTSRSVRNAVDGLSREHSRKPDVAYEMAEELIPAVARVDLFSRQPRPGWDVWGDEVGKFEPTGDAK